MAIAFGAIGAKSAGGTSTLSVAHPSGIQAGDMLIAGRATWRSTSECDPADETGWTNSGELSGGTGTAVDAHTSIARADRKIATGSESGSVTFDQTGTPGTTGGAIGVMARYTKSTGASWDVATATGSDNTHGTNRSASSSTGINFRAGDRIIAIVATDTDTDLAGFGGTFNFSASNVIFAAPTRRTTGAGVTTGNDGNIEIIDAEVTASTNTGTPIVTLNFGTSTSQCGPVVFIRLREASLEIQSASHTQFTDPVTLSPGDKVWFPRTKELAEGFGSARSFEPIETQAGDLLVVSIEVENATAGETYTVSGGGLTWTVRADTGAGGTDDSRAIIVTAPDAAGGTRTITVTPSSNVRRWAARLDLARNHDGPGGAGTATDAQTTNVTRQTDGAAVIMAVADWTAGAPSGSQTWTPSGGVTTQVQAGVGATYYFGRLHTAGAAGTASHGLSSPSLTTPVVAALEIRALAAAADLVIAAAGQAQTAQNLALTQVHELAVAGAAQGQSAQNLALSQVHALAVSAAVQAQTADEVEILVVLNVQGASQAQTAQNLALTQLHQLAIAVALQAQSAQSLALTQAHALVVASAAHGQSAGSLVFTQVHALVIQGANQAQHTGPLTLGAVTLAVQAALQVQSAQALTLAQIHELAVAAAVQAVTSGNVVLVEVPTLRPADATQAQLATILALGQVHVLSVQSAIHGHTAAEIALSLGALPFVRQVGGGVVYRMGGGGVPRPVAGAIIGQGGSGGEPLREGTGAVLTKG